MLVHSYYDEDPRVRREAESLAAAGRPVDVFALRRPNDLPDGEIGGVRVHRIDVQRHQGAGIGTYLREYLAFLVRACWAVTGSHRGRRYGLIQVHTPPDFLILAGLPLRLAGVPILLDLHEAMPEFFRSRFPRASNPIIHAGLRLQERLSIRLSTAAVTVNAAMRDRLVGLGVEPGKVSVVPNSPSLQRFDPAAHEDRPFAADGTVRLVYAGALTPTYELDVVVDAIALIRERRPDLAISFDMYGRGDSEAELRARVDRLGLSESVVSHGRIPIEEMPSAIARADIGLAPTRRDPFTDVSLSTKIFEYAAMAKPVVASRLPMVEQVFPPGTIGLYEAGDPDLLASAILGLIDDPVTRRRAVDRSLEVVRSRSWENEVERYMALVDGLARS